MVILPVFWMFAIYPFVFQQAGSLVVLILCVVRQRLYGSRVSGVVVAVLDPPIAGDHVIPDPSRWRRGLFWKPQADLVPGVHDHIAVIGRGQQSADIAVTRVVAFELTPDLLAGGDAVVVGYLRRRSVCLVHHGIAPVMKISQRWVQLRDFELCIGQAL